MYQKMIKKKSQQKQLKKQIKTKNKLSYNRCVFIYLQGKERTLITSKCLPF